MTIGELTDNASNVKTTIRIGHGPRQPRPTNWIDTAADSAQHILLGLVVGVMWL